jgi:hypothetical protein
MKELSRQRTSMPPWPRLETEGELEVRDIFLSHKDREHLVNGSVSVEDFFVARAGRIRCTSIVFTRLRQWLDVFDDVWAPPSFWYPGSAPIDTYGPAREPEVRRKLRDQARNVTREW